MLVLSGNRIGQVGELVLLVIILSSRAGMASFGDVCGCTRPVMVWLLAALLAVQFGAPSVRAEVGTQKPPLQLVLQDVYTVSAVQVDVTASASSDARDIALRQGQQQAFSRLLERIALRADAQRFPHPGPAAIDDLISGLEISNERTSDVRYLASLTVHFKRHEVRALLRQAAIPFAETVAKPTLVLPVYEVAGTRVLWNDPNPWREAWRATVVREGLTPFILPIGDIQDMGMLGAEQAVVGDSAGYKAIMQRYGADSVVVVKCQLLFDEGNGKPYLQIFMRYIGPLGERSVVEGFPGGDATARGDLLARAAESLAERLEESWKADTLINFDAELKLSARVPYGGLAGWIEKKAALEKVASIREVEIIEMTIADAQVVLHYFGNPRQLAVSLAQSDMMLVDSGGYWTIMSRKDVQ